MFVPNPDRAAEEMLPVTRSGAGRPNWDLVTTVTPR
jgi:hypothetical protein